MRKLAFALIISAMATTTHAGSDKASFLNCGVKLGGTKMAYKASVEGKDAKNSKNSYTAGPLDPQTNSFNTAAPVSTKKAEPRLPPTFTVAKFGCSW
jgi:hypothetical protein